MGQYYTPVLIDEETNDERKYLSHDYGNGLKLMEHSYLGNTFVETICNEIVEHPMRVAWVGDYADDVIDEDKYKNIPNIERFIEIEKDEKMAYAQPNAVEQNVSSLCYFIINHTKKEFIDMYAYTVRHNSTYSIIHPLPLLTSIGNGCGGGDYSGICEELCGNWCGDVIECNYYDNIVNILKEYKNITETLNFVEH